MYTTNQNMPVSAVAVRTVCSRCMAYGLLLVAAALLLASARVAAAHGDQLDVTVQYLIEFVKDSNVQFERNFSSYNSTEAAEHIENKYRHFKDEIDTPEKFIELCATRSLVTGKQYRVITADGDALPAGEWLNLALERFRGQAGQQ